MDAHYRKLNDRTRNSSTYHKKDGTNVRAKLKAELQKDVEKGEKGGECNRTVCKAQDARWYNSSTRAYYCGNCAHLIMSFPENKRLLTRED